MQIVPLRGNPGVIDEITVGVHDRDSCSLELERIDKHTYELRLGPRPFRFQTRATQPNDRPKGPGLELRHVDTGASLHGFDMVELHGRPGVLQSLRVADMTIHLEHMADHLYSCSIVNVSTDAHQVFELANPNKATVDLAACLLVPTGGRP